MTTPAKPRPSEQPRKCPKCAGCGYIAWFNGLCRQVVTCDACDGNGTVQNLHGEMTDEGSLPDE